MIKNLCAVVLLVIGSGLAAQKGDVFPTIKGINLNDKAMSVPFNNGKYTVLAIAFHRSAEEDLKKWLNPLYDSFIQTGKPSSTGIDMAEVYDVNFVFIPVIAGFKRVAEDFKNGTDKGFWQYVMDTEKTDVKAIQKALKVGDNGIPYFFVLDAAGKILEVQSGKYNAAKLSKLEDVIE